MDSVITKLSAVKTQVVESFSNESDGNNAMPRWKLALLVGVPVVVVGAGVVCYLYCSKDDKKKKITQRASKQTVPKAVEESSDPFTKAMSAKTRGNKFFKGGKYEKAIECYTEAIRLCPSDKEEDLSTFYQNRAASYEMLKQYDNVIKDCSSAISHNKKYVKAWLRRAKAYEELHNLSEALDDITAVCILERFSNQSNLLMTDRLLKQQSKKKAIEFASKRTPSMPSDQFIKHYFLSYSKHPLIDGEHVTGEKLEMLVKELSENGDDVEKEAKIALLKGTISILRGDLRNGESELEKVVKLDNCSNDLKINALIKLGTIKVHELEDSSDGLKKTLECFDQAIKLDSSHPDIYIHRAQIYILGEQIEEARKDLEKCCELAPTFASAAAQKLYVHFRCAARFNDENSVKRILKAFEEAIEEFPNSSEVHSLYAQALMEQQQFDKADDYFIKAIKCDPHDANLVVHRGILQLQCNNDIEKAVKLLEKALQVDPKCQFAYEMLGTIEVQRGNLRKGIECFEGALAVAQTEMECAHLFTLLDAAEAQKKAIVNLGVETIPTNIL